ncbi:hypothetical protein RAD15_24220 [Bradyrhizobium sp. 14AA]
MDAERKQTAKLLKCLRHNLEDKDATAFRVGIDRECSDELLTSCREQKLVLHVPVGMKQIFDEVMSEAASRHLPQPEAGFFRAYLEFAGEWQRAHSLAAEELSRTLRGLSTMNLSQLLAASGQVLRRYLDRLPRVTAQPERSVAEYERRVGNSNGLANDVFFAVIRALNEASKKVLDLGAPPLLDGPWRRNVRALEKASSVASKINALEWLFDSVSYGDFTVTRLSGRGPIRFQFDYADLRLHLLRTLAIRRDMILNLNGARAPRFVRERLREGENHFLADALEYYRETLNLGDLEIEFEALKRHSAAYLVLLNAEDDLLYAANGPDLSAATYYTTAMVMRWYSMASEFVQRGQQAKSERAGAMTRVPLYRLQEELERGGGKSVDEVIDDLTCVLPARSHVDIARRPFIREAPGLACYVPGGDYGTWNTTVREALIGGGRRGAGYGKIWEEFYVRSFAETHWKVVGRGVRLRRDHSVVTDVDILLQKNDLLLVIQVKALIGSGMTVYDHWRNRQTIVWGCRQARLAADFILENRRWLTSVLGRRAADEVAIVQPLVLTTVDTFEGWSWEGVPVIGEGGRKAITERAKVRYTSPQDHEVLHTRHVIRDVDLTTEKILWAIQNPLVAGAGELGRTASRNAPERAFRCVAGIRRPLRSRKVSNDIRQFRRRQAAALVAPTSKPGGSPRPFRG